VPGKVSPRWARLLDRCQPQRGEPHRNLMVAVLRVAIEDACDAAATQKAMAYVVSTDRLWPFSFENLCEALDMDADDIRRQLQTGSIGARTIVATASSTG
jgi:hypothetical protein